MRVRLVVAACWVFMACGAEAGTQSQVPVKRTREVRTGIWISKEELLPLPTSGPAWDALFEMAHRPLPAPRLSDPRDAADVIALAKALVAVRIGDDDLTAAVRKGCALVIGTERGGDCLAFGRNLPGWIVAADLVGLAPEEDERFREWLAASLGARHDGRSLRSTHMDRPNNWGTHAGAARVAIARYLGDGEELERAARVFRGWLGDRATYAGFRYREMGWQADPDAPVGINPRGSHRAGRSIDGVLPDDQRRAGPYTWPPPRENYVYEALQGALFQAAVLERAGFDAFEWEDRALLRAFRWLHERADYPAEGDDTWQPHLVNARFKTSFPAPVPSRPGKNVGFTDWTHAKTRVLGAPVDGRMDGSGCGGGGGE